MTKELLVTDIAATLNTTKAEAKRALEAVTATIHKAVRSGDDIKIPGFGRFQKKTRSARMGTNPNTKEKINIPAKDYVYFKGYMDLG